MNTEAQTESNSYQPDSPAIESVSHLRDYVNVTLCGQNQLEPDIFPMTERLLFQSGSPCGILFCVHGPRSIQLNAIWESRNNCVIFYGSTGEKIDKVTLEETIDLSDYKTPSDAVPADAS